MKASYHTRVRRGMKLLDEVRPGWEQEIDLETFDIADGCTCTLGQLFGSYGIGLDRLSLWDGRRMFTCGFALELSDDPRIVNLRVDREKRYGRLNEVWLEQLSARLDTDATPVVD